MIFLSDMHCMSQYAVASPKVQEKFPLKYPSIQKRLFEIWQDAVDERQQKTHALILNGEPVDGPGEISRGTETWSTELQEGVDDAYRLLKMYNPKHFMSTKGSNYHSDARGLSTEEMIMEKFKDKTIDYNPYEVQGTIEDGRTKRTYNFAWISVNDLLFSITHHITGGKWFHYITTPLGREMAALTFDADKWLPKKYLDRNYIVVRSHQHKFVCIQFGSSAGFVTPAWKLPDWYLLRGGKGGALPSLGAVEVVVEPNGQFQIYPHIAKAKNYPKVHVKEI